MTYAWMPGPEQPNTEIKMLKGQVVAGAAIGILVLDLWYPYMPGNVANASTYKFPLLFKILKGTSVPQILSADPSLLDKIVEGGNELAQQGVRAIVGACGYFGHFQKAASEHFSVPTFLSSVLQAPIIMRSLKPGQKVGIICADAPHLGSSLLTQCGVKDQSRIVVTGAQDYPEFRNIIEGTGHFISAKIEKELVNAAKNLVAENPHIGAILLECSDMPPYAWAIQNAVRVPVFDFITMTNWIYDAVVRKPFAGFV